MAIFTKNEQRKTVADHLTERMNVLLAQGWTMEGNKAPQSPKEQRPVTPLPDDFPGRAHLIEAGLATLEAVREYGAANGFDSIKGIGPVTAEEINAAL